jgi:toxin ParE1/3/4
MASCRISPQAERDIDAILQWTHESFGEKARLRYEALLIQAIEDVATDPNRAGSHDRSEIAPDDRTYHLRFSRDRVKKSIKKVQRPRHFLLYRRASDGGIEIARMLHDGMDLERHLPDDYRL